MSLTTRKILNICTSGFRRVPWWASLAAALTLYALLHGIAASSVWEIKQAGYTRLAAKSVKAFAASAQYLLPALILAGATIAFFRPQRAELFPSWSAPDELTRMSWRDFEQLASEAFRHAGFTVEHADGAAGFDWVLSKNGAHHVAQCKHWHAWNVGEQQVRELHTLVSTRRAAGGFLITSGSFTRKARKYAASGNLRLIDGAELLRLLPAREPGRPLDACGQNA